VHKCLRREKYESAEIESCHYLVRAKIRLIIRRSEKTKKSDIEKVDIGKLNKKDIKEFIKQITANTENIQS
jgi:hypothetical protein